MEKTHQAVCGCTTQQCMEDTLFLLALVAIQSAAFQLTTILATAMTDAMMTMTKAEAERFQAEQAGEERLA